MKKYFSKLFFPFLTIVILQGCSNVSSDKSIKITVQNNIYAPSDLLQCKNEEQAGLIMIESIITGLESDNYGMYIRDFTNESKQSFTNEIFQNARDAVCRNLGKINKKQYLGAYQKKGYWVLLWKAQYAKTMDDILLELYVKKVENTYKVAAFVPK